MSHLRRMTEVLPPPLSIAPDSVLASLLDVLALEMDAFEEELEQVRRSHWIETVEMLDDARRLGALLGIAPLAREPLTLYRQRLLALARALLDGGTGPEEIERYVFEYVAGTQRASGATLVPGLERVVRFEDAYRPSTEVPAFRPLALVENPRRRRSSAVLAARGGKVPYLFRWREDNRGLDEAVVEIAIDGLAGGVTTNPILVNETTGDLIGFRGVVPFGQRLRIDLAEDAAPGERTALARLNGNVTPALLSLGGFTPGIPFHPADLDEIPRLPRLARGANRWVYLSVGYFDLPSLDRTFFAIAGGSLREAVFNETAFDQSVFPSGAKARLALEWEETEPASFEVQVPAFATIEPPAAEDDRVSSQVREGLTHDLARLHAAGVRASLRFEPFAERQALADRCRLPVKILEPERGSAGSDAHFGVGARFDESPLDRSRFG